MNAVSPSIRLVYAGSAPGIEIARPAMDDVRGIVARTVGHARAMGRDDLTQTREAARAVLSVRPDLTLADALVAVGRLRALGAA